MLKKTLTRFIGNGVAVLAGVVTLHQMASALSKAEYGAYGFLMGIFGMCFCLTDFGLASAHIKAVAEGRDVKDCFRTYGALQLALLALTAAALTAIVLPQYSLIVGAPRAEARATFFLLLASWAATLLSGAIGCTFAGLIQPLRQVMPSILRNVALVALLVVLRTGHPLRDVCAASAAAGAVGLATALWLARPFFGGRFSVATARQYWRYGLRLSPGLFTGSVGKNLDTVLVGRLVSLADLAPYFAAKRFFTPLDQLGCSIDYILFPTLSRKLSTGKTGEAREIFLRTERSVLALAALITASSIFFARPILRVVAGEQYAPFAPYFGMMMAAGCAFYLLALPCASVFNGMGRPQTTSALNLTSFAILIASNVFFIPAKVMGLPALGWGAAGAVASLLLPAAFLAVTARWRVWKMLGAGLDAAHGICVASALVSACASAALFRAGGELGAWGLGAALSTTTAAHAVAVLKSGAVSIPGWRAAETRRRQLSIPDEEAVTR